MAIKLVAFDLDFTLWNTGGIWVDCTTPPYSIKNGKIRDARGLVMKLYPDSLDILADLKAKGYQLALASRTEEPSWARQLIQLFNIDHYFEFQEIYPSTKVRHLTQIANNANVELSEILFFDDELRNIYDTQLIGVKAVHVSNGINRKLVFNNL